MVTFDGWCGLCYEHSPAEGIVVIRLVEQILQNIKEDVEGKDDSDQEEEEEQEASNAPISGPEAYAPFPPPTPMEWKITSVIMKRIQESAENVDRLV